VTQYRALIIDDVPEVVILCTEILLAEGFQVHGLHSAREALNWLSDHEVDLILTDIHMPDMDGLDLVQRLRERDPEVAVVVITGFGTMENAVRALRLGTQGFVLKPFTPDELVTVVRDALEKRRTQQEAMRLRAWLPLLTMNQILVTETDLDRLSELTVDLVAREGQADLAVLLLIEPDDGQLRIQAARGLPAEAMRRIRIPVGQGLIGQLAQPGARTSALTDGASVQLPSMVPIRAALLVALRVKGVPIGVLVIGKGAGRPPFQPNDVEFFALLGGQVAIAVENARLYEAAQKRAEELAALNDISRAISSVLNLETILKMVMQAIESAIRVEEATLFLVDEQTQELVFSVTLNGQGEEMPFRLAMGQGIAGWVAQHQEAVVVNDVRQDPRFYPRIDELTGFVTRSVLCVPLRGREKTIGVLEVLNKYEGKFDDVDRALLESMAAPMAIAIENAHLFQDLQAANQELFAAKEFTERILENIPSGLVVVDLHGCVLAFNQAAKALTGYSEVEMVGRPATDLLYLLPDQSSVFRQVIEAGASSLSQEATVVHRDGTLIPVQARASVFRDDAGQVAGAVGILTDMRPSRTLEEERRRLDRLTLLGELSAIVAHEIRNPLAAVATGIPVLAGQQSDAERHKFAGMILTEIRRMGRIIDDILLVARRPKLDLQPCNPVQVVDEALARHRETIRAQGITVHRIISPGVPNILADDVRLGQVMDNLIANALQAMTEAGGHLTVECSVHRVSCQDQESRFVQIAVMDSGEGIPSHILPDIFEPFFTTKTRGTGLGLAIARRIVVEHGGDIHACSRPGEETTFVIRLWEQGPRACWQIVDCPPGKRESCPAVRRSESLCCWTVMESRDSRRPDVCRGCPVYVRHIALAKRLDDLEETP